MTQCLNVWVENKVLKQLLNYKTDILVRVQTQSWWTWKLLSAYMKPITHKRPKFSKSYCAINDVIWKFPPFWPFIIQGIKRSSTCASKFIFLSGEHFHSMPLLSLTFDTMLHMQIITFILLHNHHLLYHLTFGEIFINTHCQCSCSGLKYTWTSFLVYIPEILCSAYCRYQLCLNIIQYIYLNHTFWVFAAQKF